MPTNVLTMAIVFILSSIFSDIFQVTAGCGKTPLEPNGVLLDSSAQPSTNLQQNVRHIYAFEA